MDVEDLMHRGFITRMVNEENKNLFHYKQSPIQAVCIRDEILELNSMRGVMNMIDMRDPVPLKHKYTINDKVRLERVEYSHQKYNPRLPDILGKEGQIKTIHYNEQGLLYYTVEFCDFGAFMGRTLEDIPEEWLEPAKKYWSGKVVCVKNDGLYNYFTEGRVYTVEDGNIFDNYGFKHHQENDHRMESPTDCAIKYYKFIEFKGE